MFTNFHYLNRNKAVADCECPVSFKNVNFTPIYNKDLRLEEKTIDQLVFSLIFRKFTREYCIFKISPYFDSIPPKYRFRFTQGYSSQQCLLVLIEE